MMNIKRLSCFLLMFTLACGHKTDFQTRSQLKLSNKAESQLSTDSMLSERINSWVFNKIEGSKLIFNNGRLLETNLYNLVYLGQINVDQQAPFLIFSGRNCDECDANIAIYFHSPRNGQFPIHSNESRYDHPGRERDYITDSVVYEARAFYGEVLNNVNGIIWYQKTKSESTEFHHSVYVARIVAGKVIEAEIKGFEEHLRETLSLNYSGKNKEIKGVDYTSEP